MRIHAFEAPLGGGTHCAGKHFFHHGPVQCLRIANVDPKAFTHAVIHDPQQHIAHRHRAMPGGRHGIPVGELTSVHIGTLFTLALQHQYL